MFLLWSGCKLVLSVPGSEDMPERFSSVLRFIARHSEVKALPSSVFSPTPVLKLKSEPVSDAKVFVALTSTDAISDFVRAWWQ